MADDTVHQVYRPSGAIAFKSKEDLQGEITMGAGGQTDPLAGRVIQESSPEGQEMLRKFKEQQSTAIAAQRAGKSPAEVTALVTAAEFPIGTKVFHKKRGKKGIIAGRESHSGLIPVLFENGNTISVTASKLKKV